MSKVLVISMEKAGSTTVMHAIKSAGIEVGRVHRHNMSEVNPDDYSHFVVMVREPIAKSISNYWETKALISIEAEIRFTLEFIDRIVLPLTKSYVLCGTQFNKNSGWEIYSSNVLIIRTENLTTDLASSLSALLGKPASDFEVIHHPKSLERFGPEYIQFVNDTKFDRDYLGWVYQSNYCRKYGYDEVERWAK